MLATSKLYFKGLNGLRFFAAFFVVIYHASTFVTSSSAPAVSDLRSYSFFDNGAMAVDFFFVLSGFLITSLLIKEHSENGSISVKKFYVRRVLRIWPLYYMIVFLGIVAVPLIINQLHLQTSNDFTAGNWILYVFFLSNFPMAHQSVLLSPLWSIAVEEQFYLLIAPTVKFLRKHLAIIFAFIIAAKLFLYAVLFYYHPQNEWNNVFLFFIGLKFEMISIGGLGALFIQSRYAKCLPKLFGYTLQIIFFSLLAADIFCKNYFSSAGIPFISPLFNFLFSNAWSEIFTGFIFLYIIACVSLNKKSLIRTDNKILDFLGSISYGMYMYHVFIEIAILRICKDIFQTGNTIVATIIYYGVSLLLTIFIAWLSYKFFEKRFLNLKKKFE